MYLGIVQAVVSIIALGSIVVIIQPYVHQLYEL